MRHGLRGYTKIHKMHQEESTFSKTTRHTKNRLSWVLGSRALCNPQNDWFKSQFQAAWPATIWIWEKLPFTVAFAGRGRDKHNQFFSCTLASSQKSLWARASTGQKTGPRRLSCYKKATSGRTEELTPPIPGSPQEMREPSARMQAKAACVAWISSTFLSWCCTSEQSPP